MSTTTNLSTLKINYLTQAQYDTALANSQINENELYFTPGTGDAAGHTVLTQAEYNALTSEEKNNGTIYFISDANNNEMSASLLLFDTSAISGDDYDLTNILTTLGWLNEVVV